MRQRSQGARAVCTVRRGVEMRRAMLAGLTVLAMTFGLALIAPAPVSAMKAANGQE